MEAFDIPEGMDVPEVRRGKTMDNARWLLRNIGVRNHRHPDFHKTVDGIRAFVVRKGRVPNEE